MYGHMCKTHHMRIIVIGRHRISSGEIIRNIRIAKSFVPNHKIIVFGAVCNLAQDSPSLLHLYTMSYILCIYIVCPSSQTDLTFFGIMLLKPIAAVPQNTKIRF